MPTEIIPEQQTKPSVPGVGSEGSAGITFCPYGFSRSPCLKQGCEMWVELNYGPKIVARCSIAWQAILMVETRQEIARLREAIVPKGGTDAAA